MSLADRRDYLRRLIGKPYREGAAGPDAYDCAGLAAVVWRDVFGRALPSREDAAVVRRDWLQIDNPPDGAIVMMRGDGQHVGVWLREGGVIHALERIGVVFDRPASLLVRGLGRARFYVPTETA